MSKALSAIKNGIIDENPTFIQVIGTCPTLAVTTSAINGIGMGLSTMVVLICSNLFISLLRKIITDGKITQNIFLLRQDWRKSLHRRNMNISLCLISTEHKN